MAAKSGPSNHLKSGKFKAGTKGFRSPKTKKIPEKQRITTLEKAAMEFVSLDNPIVLFEIK